MHALSSAGFLNLWECGSRMHPVDRAVLALSAAFPDTSQASLASWPLGRRNRALAEFRCVCFGPSLDGTVPCPKCGENLEFNLDARILAEGNLPSDSEPIVVKGLAFRLPASKDMALIARERDARLATVRLLDACALEGGKRGAWTGDEIEEIGERMAAADPLAETQLSLSCAACGHEWEEGLDIASVLWEEVEARARRALFEIHSLASAYGWSEAQILALSERRREIYLEMVQA